MNIGRYHYQLTWIDLHFEFQSIGPNGVIDKVIRFRTQLCEGREMINVGLADWNESGNRWDDSVKSNNNDTIVILATVASACLKIAALCPTVEIYAKGSTPSRNRLYQMGIVKHWDEISSCMDVEGMRDGGWQPFIAGVEYDAFHAKPKKQ